MWSRDLLIGSPTPSSESIPGVYKTGAEGLALVSIDLQVGARLWSGRGSSPRGSTIPAHQ